MDTIILNDVGEESVDDVFHHAPQLRDNYVEFHCKGGINIVSGFFNVTGLKVSGGQPQDIVHHMTLDSKDRLLIRAGQHPTEVVAEWFRHAGFGGNCNTFGQNPGKLNFAVCGDLTLYFKDDIFGDEEKEYTFVNVALAQGKDRKGQHNWWFGGSHCVKQDGHSVKVYGTGKHGNSHTLPFFFATHDDHVDVITVSVDCNVKYNKNTVILKNSGKQYISSQDSKATFESSYVKLHNGSFTVTNFCIPVGQDPVNEIYVGMSKNFDQSGKITFRIAQHLSSTAAVKFHEIVKRKNNNFSAAPNQLYFWIQGTLLIYFTGGRYGTKVVCFEFPDIVFAQGQKVGGGNNWWFGSPVCESLGEWDWDAVTCLGADVTHRNNQASNFMFFCGRRGPLSTKPNEVKVIPPRPPTTPAPVPNIALAKKTVYYSFEVYSDKWYDELRANAAEYDKCLKIVHEGTSTYCYVFREILTNEVFVVFRGSDSKTNYILNIATDLIDYPPDNYSHKAKVHGGFLISYNSVRDTLYDHLRKINGVDRIVFTGHSLGGALAVLASCDLKAMYLNMPNFTVQTYGQPKVGNESFVLQFRTLDIDYWRFVMLGDPVTILPLGFYSHMEPVYYLVPPKFYINPFENHNKSHYYTQIQSQDLRVEFIQARL